jgi:hypothetical protein
LNGSGVTGSPAGDVVIGYNGQPIGLRVLSSGNSSFAGAVGIGTPTPTKKLQVAGSMSLNNDNNTTDLNSAYFLFDGGSSGWGTWSFGTSLGFKNNRYRTMLFAPDGADVAISPHAAGPPLPRKPALRNGSRFRGRPAMSASARLCLPTVHDSTCRAAT